MTDKGISSSSTVLIENGVIISDPKDVCPVFNAYVSSIAEYIGKPDYIKDNESIESVIERHSNHPSVLQISQNFNVIDTFEFTTVAEVQVEKQIKSVNPKKATGYDQIPPRIIKLCHKELTPALTKIIDNSISQCVFPSDLKKAEVIPLYKKKDHLLKEKL